MMKLAVFALLVAAASSGIVTPVDRCEDCGGEGFPFQLRVTNCEGAPPCTIVPNTDYTIESDFIAAHTSTMANFKLTARTVLGEFPVADGPIGAVNGGSSYTASQTITIPEYLRGPLFARIEIYHSACKQLEICIEVSMNVQ